MYKVKLTQRIIALCLGVLFTNAASADDIKIGIVGPFSGPYVAAGDQQWLGATQAVDDINAEGGVDGRKLVLISADDACNPEKAVKIAKKMVAAGDIEAVIGHNCSSATLAAAKIYAEANMLMISPASTTPEITAHNYKSIFRTCGKDDSQGKVAAYFISKKLKAKNVAVVNDGSVYGKVVAENTKVALDELGDTPILYAELIPDKSNKAKLFQQIADLKPDLIYFGGLHTDAGNFLKELREYGNKVTFFGSDGLASPDFVQAAGGPNIVQGVYMTFFNDPLSIPEAKNVVNELQEKRISPTGYILNSYAAVQVIVTAMQHVPRDQMSDWLHHNKVDSVLGPLEWDKNGDLKKAAFIVYKWNNEGGYSPYWTP